jgi:hypothetical protein
VPKNPRKNVGRCLTYAVPSDRKRRPVRVCKGDIADVGADSFDNSHWPHVPAEADNPNGWRPYPIGSCFNSGFDVGLHSCPSQYVVTSFNFRDLRKRALTLSGPAQVVAGLRTVLGFQLMNKKSSPRRGDRFYEDGWLPSVSKFVCEAIS